MEVEQKQADLVLLARDARGRAAAELITHATSNPQLFAFSELLSCSHIAEVIGLFSVFFSYTRFSSCCRAFHSPLALRSIRIFGI
jgi:hypothetical protein